VLNCLAYSRRPAADSRRRDNEGQAALRARQRSAPPQAARPAHRSRWLPRLAALHRHHRPRPGRRPVRPLRSSPDPRVTAGAPHDRGTLSCDNRRHGRPFNGSKPPTAQLCAGFARRSISVGKRQLRRERRPGRPRFVSRPAGLGR
jgi:hypothetical protein